VHNKDTMTGSELAARLAAHIPELTAVDADLATKAILFAIAASLASGSRVEIRGFGSFFVNLRPPRVARNPKTGVAVSVPAKKGVRFKAGNELRQRVDALGSPPAKAGPLGDLERRGTTRRGVAGRSVT
jgi:integration host factor subunit beta